ILTNLAVFRSETKGYLTYIGEGHSFKKLASKSLHEIDHQDPNLYAHLKHQLWEIFSPELIKKSLVITHQSAFPNHLERGGNDCMQRLQMCIAHV
ncbi:alphaK I25, partial [Puccinia sorghi]